MFSGLNKDFQGLLGTAQWIVLLGQIDITKAVHTLLKCHSMACCILEVFNSTMC
jgi:hypothetical protein